MADLGTIIALIKKLGGGGGGGGTSNYNSLSNKPSINGATLSGDKSGDDLGLIDSPETAGTDGQVLTSDGQGGVSWKTPSGGGAVDDVQVNGTSVVQNGVANVPMASSSDPGVVKVNGDYGIKIESGILATNPADGTLVKAGSNNRKPITPYQSGNVAFYGLAKAAGDSTQSASSNAVGTYTATAKSAIQQMLGVEPGVSFVETVSGTTPSITGEANVRYICGEVTSISITPQQTGTIVVRFTSGTTPAVLTLPQTVKFPAGVDLTTLEADTVYEIMITDGVYGGVMTWAD